MELTNDLWRWVFLGAAVVFAVGEIFVAGTFFLLPFAIGSAAASATAFATASESATWVVFTAVSVVGFATLVPLGRRLDRTTDRQRGVGANRWEGRRGVVLVEIPGGPGDTGLVRVDREEWRAESVGNAPIAVGAEIAVLRVDGTRLVVEPVDESASATHP